jgi:hypothetical protein
MQLGRGITYNGNITASYTNNEPYIEFQEITTAGGGANNTIDPPYIFGNINLAGGGIGLSATGSSGSTLKVYGNINHTGTNMIGNTDLRTLAFPALPISYGGYKGLAGTINGDAAAQYNNTLIMAGNVDSYIKWPTNFYVDQLIVDKTVAGKKLTLDTALIVGSHLKVKNGILELNGEAGGANGYKAVVMDSLIVYAGAGIKWTSASTSTANANILLHKDFNVSAFYIPTGTKATYTNYNTIVSPGNYGLSSVPNAKFVIGRNFDFRTATADGGDLFLLESIGSFLQADLKSNARIRSIDMTNFLRINLENNTLLMLNPPTAVYGSIKFFNCGPFGRLKLYVANTPVLFPLGIYNATNSNSNYTPVTLTNNGTADWYSVGLRDTTFTSGNAGNQFANNIISRTFNIEEETAGGSNVNITTQWNAANQLSGFDPTNSYVAHYSNNDWDFITRLPAAGAGPYTQTRTGVTSFSPFTVTSSPTPLCAASPNTITPPAIFTFCGSGSIATLDGSSIVTTQPNTVKWVKSTNNINYTVISGETGEDYTPATFTQTTYIKRVVETICKSDSSNTISVIVNPYPALGNDITLYKSCYGDNTDLTTLFNTTGLTTNWNTANINTAPPGNYRLIVYSPAGCADTAFANIILEVATWTGAINDDWNTAGNWDINKVPTSVTHVIVPAGTPNPCVVNTANATAASIQVRNGGTVQTNNNNAVMINGNCLVLPP